MGKSRSHRFCFAFLRLSSSVRSRTLSRRTLIIAAACAVYLGFVVSQVGHSQHHRFRQSRGLYHPNTDNAPSDAADSRTDTNVVVPTRSNVVYITLKSKRLKPANIRGTVRPKLRRKVRRNKSDSSAFTHNRAGTAERDTDQEKRVAPETSWTETRDVDYRSLNPIHGSDTAAEPDPHSGSIRIYSQRAPPWLSAQDVRAMRFLAGAKVRRVREPNRAELPSLLIFEGETRSFPPNQNHAQISDCAGGCGVISGPVDTAEVFAFHLDRVLGLNRTLAAVSRRFGFLHDGRPRPVVSWEDSLFPQGFAAGPSTVALTWGQYQNSLKQRCWYKNISPKSDSGCSTVHHYEWSKLALFDFLLQIHNRLDQNCCGFRPRQADVCVGHRAECGDQNHVRLANIVHRDRDPRHLVFTNNQGFFDRNEDNLDFRLLDGIQELPEEAVSVLRSRRLREKLLQSLFLDRTYWENQGGRPGIDKLIDVVERRAEVLLTYINAHGIKVVTMTT